MNDLEWRSMCLGYNGHCQALWTGWYKLQNLNGFINLRRRLESALVDMNIRF